MNSLVTGGAASGKSAFAEQLAVACGSKLVYLATMRPFGSEGARRVSRHRAQRTGKGFTTVECYAGFENALVAGRFDGATVLLEDLGNYVANALFDERENPELPHMMQDIERGVVPATFDRMEKGLAELSRRAANLVIVGNEVGCDGVAYGRETRLYQEALGWLACRAAAGSELVVECVAGIPVAVKAPAGCEDPARCAWARAVEMSGGRP